MTKFKINRVVCINLKPLDQKQMFSISEKYTMSFESLLQYKKEECNKVWICLDTFSVIAIEEQLTCKYTKRKFDPEFIVCTEFCPVTKKEYDGLKKMKPIDVPKVQKSERALNAYSHYLKEGYDIRMVSLDRKIEYLKNNSDINEDKEIDLNSLLAIAVKEEDYLKAAEIQKKIKKLENSNVKNKLDELNTLLQNAIEEEDYLKAAELRDKITELEKTR
jgi:UvrB/uvrC motif